MKSSKKIGVFSFFILFSLVFNGPAIVFNFFSEPITFYLAIVFFAMMISMSLLNKNKIFNVDLIDFEKTPKFWINLNLTVYFIAVLIFIYYNFTLINIFEFVKGETHSRRLDAISINKYWIFEAFVKIGFALSVLFVIQKKYLLFLIITVLYILFYMISVQKAPLVTFAIVNLIVYLKFNKINLRIIFISSCTLVLILYYFTIVTLGDFDFHRFDLLFNAILERVLVAGDLMVFGYKYFHEMDLRFYGATLPKLFGILDLNLSGANVRLPAFLMSMYSYDDGGANVSFFFEGFANFGIGFDLIFILILIISVAMIVQLIKIKYFKLHPFFLVLTSILLIDIVHSDYWTFFHPFIFLFIYHFLGILIIKNLKSSGSKI